MKHAQYGRLIVREFSAEDDKRVTIFFDTRIRKIPGEKKKSLRERLEDVRELLANFLTLAKGPAATSA